MKTASNLPNSVRLGLLLSVLPMAITASAATTPTAEEMWRIIQDQQKQIEALTARVAAYEGAGQSTAAKVDAIDAKVEATTAFVEELQTHSDESSTGDAWYRRTQLGGYGELHVNFGNSDVIDFHRWVAFLGHDFSDKIRFFSEFELEHSLAGEGKKGEVEIEQAFVEFDLADATKARAGLFLVPVGMLNETHEPNTFYGVERNRVEGEIIPTTWWEAGAGLTHQYESGLALDVALHSGLSVPTSGSNAFRIRSGRQKVSEAPASDGAITARLKYTGIAGLELAATAQFQQDITQGALAESTDATLFSAHADWRRGGFGLRALYARWDLDGSAAAAVGADEKWGYYLEPSYRFATPAGAVGLFARYSRYDLAAGDSARSANGFWDFGVNYWPHERVVLKADLQVTDFANPANDDEILNLGAGYQF